MSLDKLAHPDKLDKLGGGADFDDKKSGSPRITTRLALSGPASLAVLLLAGAVAFGHTSGFFASAPSGDPGTAAVDVESEADEPTASTPKPAAITGPAGTRQAAPKHGAGEDELALARRTPKPEPVEVAPEPKEPKPEPKPELKPEPQQEPALYVEPKPTPQPAAPAPATTVLALSASLSDHPGKVALGWSPFTGDGFAYYKLVRTTDGDATWPGSGADELVAAIGNAAETWAMDRPPCGTTVFFRVFAVRHGEYGYQALASSNQTSAVTECPAPPPATTPIGFEASVVDGAVHLTWGPCASENVNAFKIVRSQTNPEPMYPDNGGSELIAAVDPSQTSFVDGSVASGQTWFYRVLARADNGGGTYIACQTQALSVTIP